MKQWIFRFSFMGLILCGFSAFSEELKAVEIKAQVLETVVVTAGRMEGKKEDVTTNITVVSEEQIQQSSA